MNKLVRKLCGILCLLLPAMCLAARADDWPQWRGPQRDGVWRETGIVEAIPPQGLRIRWRARVGMGYSGPVVAAGRVFVTDHVLRPSEVERVLCFEETTGKLLWTSSYPVDYADMEYGNGPRAAPTVHDGKVYTFGTQGHLVCLDVASGDVVWKKDLAKEFEARILRYGASAAPLVEGDVLIVVAGGQPEASETVLGFDRRTGAVRWRALEDRPAYSAPICITSGGRRQAIVWTADHVNSLDPATGDILWQYPYKTTFDEAQVVAAPVLDGDRLLCLTAWNRGSFLLKLDAERPAAAAVWKTRGRPSTTISTPVFQGGHAYLVDGGGELSCIDAATGDEVWHSKEALGASGASAHFTPHGDRIFLFDHQGHLILAKLSPEGYRQLGRCLLIEPTAGYRAQPPITWAHPAYANRCVYARNDRELVCASLAADDLPAAAPPEAAIPSRLLTEFKDRISADALAWSHDGRTLAVASNYGTVKLLDLAQGEERPGSAKHNDWVCALAFSRDDRWLVSAGGSEFKPARNGGKTTGEVKLWDLQTSAHRGVFAGHTSKVFSVAFSPNGQLLATGSADQTVRLWDVATLAEHKVLQGHTDAVWSVAFSPDGKTLASTGGDHRVKLWNVATGEPSGELAGHEEEVFAVAFSPDGGTIATGGADWTVRTWEVDPGKVRHVLKGHRGSIYCLAFSADSRTLATGSADETVQLWDVAKGEPRETLRGHGSGVVGLSWAAPSKTLAAASRDGPVRLWDLKK